MPQSHNLEKMQDGREAAAIDAMIRPLINDTISSHVRILASYYRGGQTTHDFLLGKVAEITALLNLLSALEAAQRIGDGAADKEFGNAKDS